jgi:hypothetical protein
MKKTLKILKTATASTLLLSLATACGAEEQGTQSKSTKVEPEQNLPSKAEEQKFKFKITEIQDSAASVQCIVRCKIQEQ